MNTQGVEKFSEQIRARAAATYIGPARRSGQKQLSIAVRDLMKDFPEFAVGRQSIFCSALKARQFLRENHLRLEKTDGPRKLRGTSVVYHYVLEPVTAPKREGPMEHNQAARLAQRLLAPLQGLLAQEIAAHGGVEGYMAWVRSDAPTA